MSNQKEHLPQPEKISGDDYQIMIKIARYAENHEPLNEYFDPVRTQLAFERERHTWSLPEVLNYQRIFPEAVAKQQEAFSEIFKIIEELLTENPDRDIKVLDKAYVEMAKLYGFNKDLNDTYIRFRNYYIESRDFMKRLEMQFPNRADLVERITGFRPHHAGQFTIKRGPFAFEIRVTQEFLNNFDSKKVNKTSFQKIKEKLIPSTNLGGVNNVFMDYRTETTANFILYPMDEPIVDFFRSMNEFFYESQNKERLKKLNLPLQRNRNTKQSLKIHENQHALYNLILTAERAATKQDVIKEIEAILKNTDPNAILEADFSNFCHYLVENSFYENASHEILARVKDGNFIASIPTINNPNAYDYIKPYIVGIDLLENLFIEETLNNLLEKGNNAQQFRKIYDSYAEQSRDYIFNVTLVIAKFLQKHPDKNIELTNWLMFKKFSNWTEEVQRYSRYLQNSQ
jgi:hypothetical protein